ncbi:hypothetical protein HYY27_04705, partial [bacterium]|nr:hypothetical protein [bacterium]
MKQDRVIEERLWASAGEAAQWAGGTPDQTHAQRGACALRWDTGTAKEV